MLALVLGWVLPRQSTPILLHKRPKGRLGLHAETLYLSLKLVGNTRPYLNDVMKLPPSDFYVTASEIHCVLIMQNGFRVFFRFLIQETESQGYQIH